MAAKPVSAVNRRSKRSRSNESMDTVTKAHRAELLHTQLLAEYPGIPMTALWEALIDKTFASEALIAIINDPSCGIERRSEVTDVAMRNPAFDLTLQGGATPLMLAALSGRDDVMKALLSLNASVDAKEDTNGYTALHISALTNNSLAIEMLIASGGQENATDNFGSIPLHMAASNDSLKAVKLLISKRSDVNAVDRDGNTPLHWAARSGKTMTVKLLIDSGSHVNADKGGNTPLHWAARSGDSEAVKLLIDSGGDVNVVANFGWTPLHWAARSPRYSSC